MPKNIFSQVAINFFFVDNIEEWKKEIHIVESAENMEKRKPMCTGRGQKVDKWLKNHRVIHKLSTILWIILCKSYRKPQQVRSTVSRMARAERIFG